jgi:RNA polymerase sigma factor (sigma-70 family)
MLEKLAKHHDLWIKMLVNLGCNAPLAQDLVQDMYIRLHRLVKDESKIMYGNDINRYFIWTTLRNMYFSRLKSNKQMPTYELNDNDDLELDSYNIEKDNSFESIQSRIDEIVSTWSVYDKKLFSLYFIQGMSLRKIAKGAGIGLNSIHNSVKSYREALREELSEDLMDYFNGDYDKI